MQNRNFKSSFFPWTIVEWNKLYSEIQNLSSSAFKEHLIKGIRPPSNSVFNIHNLIGLKYITRLRLGLSHLNEQRFNPNFENFLSPKCICSSESGSILRFSLHCQYDTPIRKTLFKEIKTIDGNLLKLSNCKRTDIFFIQMFPF